jgi:hypothetical protein
MDFIEQRIKEKLFEIKGPLFEELDCKAQGRLKEVEMEINRREQECEQIIKTISNLKITKSAIANSNQTSFTRKTLYNDSILNQYVDYSINQENDYFNDRKLTYLKKQHTDLKSQYEKVLFHLTENNVLELEIKKLKEEIGYLSDRSKVLEEKLIEKDIKIRNLQKNIEHNNLMLIGGNKEIPINE